MYISDSTVTLTSCFFTSNTAVRSNVQVEWPMMQILNSLFLPLFCRSVNFRECVDCRRCSCRLPDDANTKRCLPVSLLSVGRLQVVRKMSTLIRAVA